MPSIRGGGGSASGVHDAVRETESGRVSSSSPASPREAPHPLSPRPAMETPGCPVGVTHSLKVTTEEPSDCTKASLRCSWRADRVKTLVKDYRKQATQAAA